MGFEIVDEREVRIGDSSNLYEIISVYGQQIQELKDAIGAVLKMASIEESSGIQLDRIGEIVCLTRQEGGKMIGSRSLADTDSVYRLLLKYKAIINSSERRIEDVIIATKLIFGATSIHYREIESIPATFYMDVTAPFSDVVMSLLDSHNLVVKPDGVKVRTSYSKTDTEIFGFVDINPNCAGFGEGVFAQSIQ